MKKYLVPLSLVVMSSAQATTVNGFDANFYGFIKASSMYASEALASYNNINLSAPTHAVAHTRPSDQRGRMSFQSQQTRMGVNLKKGDNLSAKLEFDFIDFNKSSPTTQMNPRVRIAAVTYAWDNQKVVIGQDWDLFSPVTSFTFDYVGLYFMAGNTGFMRQQAQYLITEGKWELGAALGMAGNNPGVTDADLELGKSPTYSARASYALEKGRVGVSAIYSKLNFQKTLTATNPATTVNQESHHDAYAFNAFYENSFGDTTVKSEAYYGQNLSNLGALSIGKGTFNSNAKEFGGTLTASHKINAKHVPFAGMGIAKIDNRTELTPFAPQRTGAVITAPGVRSNFLVRVGWEYKVTEDFSWVSEVSRYDTTSKVSSNGYQKNIAGSVESGVQLRF